MLLRFVLKPLVETSIHVFFLYDTKCILGYLCVSELLTLILMLVSEMAVGIHECKQLFVADCLV